jgi:hypothetical protein
MTTLPQAQNVPFSTPLLPGFEMAVHQIFDFLI